MRKKKFKGSSNGLTTPIAIKLLPKGFDTIYEFMDSSLSPDIKANYVLDVSSQVFKEAYQMGISDGEIIVIDDFKDFINNKL